MTDLPSLQQLDSPMWSLVHEMRSSIFFPLVALCVLINWRAAVVVCTIVSVACVMIESEHKIDWMFDPVRTLSYLFLFAAGAALASQADAVRRALGRCPVWLQLGLWVVALRLVTVPVEAFFALITAAGALLLIALAFGTPGPHRVLSTNVVLTWLGRVSYSLYLVHFPLILTCVHLLYGRLPLPVILGFAIVASLATAELMHRLIEQPSIELGRRVAALPALQWSFPLRRKLAGSSDHS